MKNAHAVLGVPPDASLGEIKQAYIKRTRIVHPDRFDPETEDWRNANNMLRELNEAYAYLKKIHQNQPRNSQQKQNTQPPRQGTQPPKQNVRREATTPPPSGKPQYERPWEDPNFKPYQPGTGYQHITQQQRAFPHVLLLIFVAFAALCFIGLYNPEIPKTPPSSSSRPTTVTTNASQQAQPPLIQNPVVQIGSSNSAPSKQVAPEPSILFEIDEPEIELPPEQPIPESGTYWNSTDREEEAPFTIQTSGTGFYFIKLVTLKNETAMEFFVHAGDTIEFDVPLGSYRMRYAAGEKWYGEEELFGPDTSCSKSNNIFDFHVYNDRIRGYSVTLYKIPGGNMQTYKIPRSEF